MSSILPYFSPSLMSTQLPLVNFPLPRSHDTSASPSCMIANAALALNDTACKHYNKLTSCHRKASPAGLPSWSPSPQTMICRVRKRQKFNTLLIIWLCYGWMYQGVVTTMCPVLPPATVIKKIMWSSKWGLDHLIHSLKLAGSLDCLIYLFFWSFDLPILALDFL